MKVYAPAMQWWSEWEGAGRVYLPPCTVHEPKPEQRFSGLLDASGNKLMVTEQTEPVGFVIFDRKL